VGAEAASPQPTVPSALSMRTRMLSACLTVTPAIATGFYYDFDVPRPFTDEDLAAIEGEMQTIVDADVALGDLGAFKLLSVAGGEKHPMRQRIYGTAFTTRKELDEHLHGIEEARRRDHRKLGQELDLFSVAAEGEAAGRLLWHPRGARLRYLAEQFFCEEHLEHGYELVGSPGSSYCPSHVSIYQHGQHGQRSHRDLPLRFAELGSTQGKDDAHVFMARDQLAGELERTLDLCLHVLRTFGFTDFELVLATRPAFANVHPCECTKDRTPDASAWSWSSSAGATVTRSVSVRG